MYKGKAIEISQNILLSEFQMHFAKSNGHLHVFILFIFWATCDAIEHSSPLKPLSSFDFWYVSFLQFFYNLTGCSFSVPFDKSSSFNSLNIGIPCIQSSDFYLFSLSSSLLSLFLLGESLLVPWVKILSLF